MRKRLRPGTEDWGWRRRHDLRVLLVLSLLHPD